MVNIDINDPDSDLGSMDREGIAIIGMTGRFPGAQNIEEFWQNLKDGVDSISFFTDAELKASGIDLAAPENSESYVKARGVLKDIELFDAAFFGINPKEAEILDPQQRIFLEGAWEAVENAGYDPDTYAGSIGVYAGMCNNSYFLSNLQGHPELIEMVGAIQTMMGNEKDYLATRVSYKLNLKGPSVNIYTACSTSLVAVAQACQGLLSYQCDMALSGAITVTLPQLSGYVYRDDWICSPDGHTRTFDAQAHGTVFSNGMGIVVLKRLADALDDGDSIYAVIKGSALNNDGASKVSYTAPSVDGQTEVIVMAQALAGIEAESISYVEAHGTGTVLGDPIEFAALTQAFRASTDAKGFCAIGSVKTNIGHLDAAAGMAGLIKTTLALKHKSLPPSLHFEKPNPEIDLVNSPFYVNTKLAPWETDKLPRRAGVSCFGVGGTNSHVVLEEAPLTEASGPTRPWQLLLLSAKTSTALDTATANLTDYLGKNPQIPLADVAYTLQVGRKAFKHRRMLVCRDINDATAVLASNDSKRMFTSSSSHDDSSVVFMFPGQGAQHINMALELYRLESMFTEQVDLCAEFLKPLLGLDLRTVLYPAEGKADEAQQQLTQTFITQPALFTIEYALARLWMAWGVLPKAMIGHSIGEYVAACLSGVLSLEDALTLVAARGRLIQDLPAGAMLAVFISEEDVQPLLGEKLSLATVNSPSRCVVSGSMEAVEELQNQLARQEIAHRRLHTSHAFHSEMMEPILKPFAKQIKKAKLHPPQIPFISNVTGTWITPAEATDPNYWIRHLRQTVRFAAGLQELFKESGRVFLEVGPGQTLSAFAKQHPSKPIDQPVIASCHPVQDQESDVACLLSAMGSLWLAGVRINWPDFYALERRQRIALPTYPFERKRYWVEPALQGREKIPSTNDTEADFKSWAALAQQRDLSAKGKEEKEITMPAPELGMPSSLTRQERLVPMLSVVFSELLGLELDTSDKSKTFLEMGFDSLSLTQAMHGIQKKFKVRVTFRQLLESSPTLDTLASYIDQKLPPEEFQEIAPRPAPPVARESPHASQPSFQTLMDKLGQDAVSQVPIDSTHTNVLERVVAQQLKLMAQQLEDLRNSHAAGATSPSLYKVNQTVHAAYSEKPAVPATKIDTIGGETPVKQFGPFKPIQKGASGGLTEAQQKHLDALIERYTRRTAGSKQLTQAHRAKLSDPRTVSGFRVLWKEMVYPIVAARSQGSKIWDVDGNEYIDVVMGFGVHMFGYSPPFITAALEEQLKQGIALGPQSTLAGKVAELFCEFTGMERAVFCNTGSEAVMAALRAARTVTGRDKIALFSGDYHGIFDEVLVRANTLDGKSRPLPIAPGIPEHMVQDVLVLEYGALEALDILKAHAHELAAVLIEPVQARNPNLQPKEFLHEVRRITEASETALIFDEVVTGFRVHPGGAQAWFGVRADIATYGKVVGGGMPIGIVAGKAMYMDVFDGGMWSYGDDSFPETGVTFFAGTFVRHPLAMAAAWAVLNHLKSSGPELQQRLNQKTTKFVETLNAHFKQKQVPIHLMHFSSLIYISYEGDPKFLSLLFFHLREKGIHAWEGRLIILSTAHTDKDFARLIQAFKESIEELQRGGFHPEPPPSPTDKKSLPHPTNTDSSSKNPSRAASASASETSPVASFLQDTRKDSDLITTLPLTEAQAELWVAAQMGDEASRAFNDSLYIHLRGPLHVEALHKAIQQLVDRHDALRTTFSPTGDFQEIATALALDIPFVDISGLEGDKAHAQMMVMMQEQVRQSFDLAKGPLLRVCLFKLEEQSHCLFVGAHHIVCDGWSMGGVLLDELSKLYSSAQQGVPCPLGKAMQFSEYVEWQGSEQQRSEQEVSGAYWAEQFSGSIPILQLPTDHPRPLVRTYNSARHLLTVDSALYQDIKRVGAQQACTSFTTLLAVFEVWLHRLTGQEDIVVGIPAAGQVLAGGKGLVGHCVNFLPVRKRVSGETTFTDFLKALKDTVLDAYDHQSYTYGSLLKKLKLQRDPSRAPLVSVTFNIDIMDSEFNFSNLNTGIHSGPKDYINFDLRVNAIETNSGLTIEWDYLTDLFDKATIERFVAHFHTLLNGIVANPTQRLVDLPVLTPTERHQLLVEWNATTTDYPKDASIHILFEAQVERDPDAIALVFEGASLSYGELNKQANQVARHLRQLGIEPGVPVGLCVTRSFEMIVALLGILKAGGAYVPLDPSYPRARLNYLLDDTHTPLILTQAQFADTLSLHPNLICMENIDVSGYSTENLSAEIFEPTAQSVAYIMYTSGSTGQPKGVRVTHQGVVRLVKETHYASFSPDEVFLQFAPLAFDASTFEIWGSLLNGARLVIFSPSLVSLEELGQVLVRERVTTLWLTAGLFHQMVDERIEDLGQVRQLLAGGDILSVSHVRKVLETLPGCTLINGYGPTENTTFSCCYPMHASLHIGASVPIGRPIANTQVYILDAELQPVPIGVTGEIYIGGDGLALGYLNHAELTAEKFIPHPFSDAVGARLYRSGDLARYLPDGDIEFLGRRDHQVKIRGFRIELGEIEAALVQHPSVREAVVTVREDSPGDKRLAAYLVPASRTVPETADIRDYLKAQLPEYMVPAAFVVLPKLPLTANGKVDRKALPAPDVKTDTLTPYLPPRDSLEFQLAKLWEKALARPHIGIHDNFFEHGGHSLSAVRLVANIKKAFGIALPLASLFQAPTIEQLAVLLRQRGWKQDWTALVALQPAGDKPPFFCLPGGGGNLFGMRQLVRHMGEDQPFYGLQPPALSKGQALSSVEAMAVYYLREIRTLQPEGPYYLGGGCFGGLVALEMAQQLRAQGQEVALLVLIDTPPSPEPSVGPKTPWSNVRMHRENLALLGWRDEWLYLSERVQRKLTLGIKKLACKLFLKGGYLPAALREQYVFDSDVQAQKQYVARPYQGRLTLLWASKDIAQRYQDSYRVAWKRLALGGVESYDLPCDHIGIFREPQVSVLAERLKESIDQASRLVSVSKYDRVTHHDRVA